MKRPTATKSRSCVGKKRHATKQAALDHLARLIACGAAGIHTYRCRHCRGWHVGHAPKPR